MFVKRRITAPPDFFACEAAGLQWLSAADGGVSCAEVIAYDDASLTLERLDVAVPTRAAVSRCPPCGAGSISTAPVGVHITLPLRRSPCSRAGGSSSSKSPAAHRSITVSTASRVGTSRRVAARSAIGDSRSLA